MTQNDVKVLLEVPGGRLVQSATAAERARMQDRLRTSPKVIARGDPGEATPPPVDAPA